MQSIGATLDKRKGFGPGFDFLRIALASSVIWFHSFVVIGQMDSLKATCGWFYIYSIMPMFFALSGFLIAASAQRLNLPNFLLNRGLRIVPALIVEICVSSLIIGPIFTRLSYHDYFFNSVFWHYYTNIFGWIQYKLPGVFESLPSAGIVNLSLWTIPFEIGCYALISFSIIFRLANHLNFIIGITIALLIIPIIAQAFGFVGIDGKTSSTVINYLLFTRGAVLFPSFLLGAIAYFLRYQIPTSSFGLIGCIIFCIIISFFGNDKWKDYYLLNLFSIPVLVYLTILIGISPMPKIPLYSKGDYSYGVYLYGYPLQQTLISLFPHLTNWLYFFMGSVLAATMWAMISGKRTIPHYYDIRHKGQSQAVARLQFEIDISTGKISATSTVKGAELPPPILVDEFNPQWAEKAAEAVLLAVLESG